MLSYKEFDDKCRRWDSELAAEQKRQQSFIDDLQNALIEISFQYFPETIPHKHHFIEDLTLKAHQEAVYLSEVLDLLVGGYSSDDFSFYNENHVPKRDVSDEEKEYLEDILNKMLPEQQTTFIKLNTERVKIEAKEREFVFLCYDKAKELIAKYFPEINEFSGNSIRNVDYSAYHYMDEWTYDFYYFTSEYLRDEY